MSTLQLHSISVGELTVQLLPTKWCVLGVSVRSLHVRLVTIKNEGSVLQGYSKAGLHLGERFLNRGSCQRFLADGVRHNHISAEETRNSRVLGPRGECGRF